MSSWIVTPVTADTPDTPTQETGPYRPSEWQNAPIVTITVPGNDPGIGGSAPVVNGSSAALIAGGGQIAKPDPSLPGGYVMSTATGTTQIIPDTVLVFDAVIRTEHQHRITKTEHPIQTGANVADHAIIEPARVVLEIGMSDAMDSFTPGQWGGNASKSVSAFQQLVKLARARQPLTVTTRLGRYLSMVLTSISAPDTVETRFGLRATVTFEKLFTGTTSSQQVSARPDLTGKTSIGTKQALPVSSEISRFTHSTLTTVPAAGQLSSNPVTK